MGASVATVAMKLLIVTQAVDADDPILGFFCRWIEEFATRVERVEVICLREGKHALPANVRVHSLGKERGRPVLGAAAYALRFIALAWRLRRDYDAVFVHMNQEYVLIAGWLWKIMGRHVYLWRNHYAGSWLTDIAAAFCTKIFCTSKYSYTARYAKVALMPVGVDTSRFAHDSRVTRVPHSILFLARIAPAKRPEILLGALAMLNGRGVRFTATFVGSPLPEHESYYADLIAQADTLGLRTMVSFKTGVPNSETPKLYQSHEIFVNTSPSGMLDKTLFEAGACGAIPLAMSDDWATVAGTDLSFAGETELSERLERFICADVVAKKARIKKIQNNAVEQNALSVLADRLFRALHA